MIGNIVGALCRHTSPRLRLSIQVITLITLVVVCLVSTSKSHSNPDKDELLDTSAPTKKPNILFIFADDQSPDTIGAYGNKHIKTPNIDMLAEKGVSFSNAHNMGAWNGAVCLASRAMLNSGRSVWQAYKMDKQFAQGEGLDTSWSKMMEKQGYDTYMTGKWHVAAPASSVFNTVTHVRPGMPNDTWDHNTMETLFDAFENGTSPYSSPEEFIPLGYNRPLNQNDKSWSPTDPKFGGFYEGGKHWSEVLKDDALAFINTAKNKENPFFMYIAFNAPHDPRQAPQAYQDLYDASALPLPVNWLDNYPEREEIENGPRLRDAALAPFPRTEYATRVHLKEYYAIVSHLDTQVGEILKALKESGKMDNTYVIYTADHGLAVGEHGLFGKQNMYEHSIRAPFIIWGPDIKGGKVVDANIYLQDAMATSLALAGAEKPEHVFFHSILELAKGSSTKSNYDAIYGAYVNSQRMIKKDGYKLIVYPNANKVKLFNLQNDPKEMINLAEKVKHKKLVSEMFKELLELQSDFEDELDLKPMYEHYK
jgi:arylsulfatase A-like enzyme